MPQTAAKRLHLDRAVRERPEFGGAFSLFRALLAYIDGREGSTGISFRPQPRNGPLLVPADAAVEKDACTAFLEGLLDVLLAENGKMEGEVSALKGSLRKGALDLPRLVPAAGTGDKAVVEEAARALPSGPPLLLFVLDIALNTALEAFAEAVPEREVGAWREGTCPVCGGTPAMDELCGEEGRRYLSCSRCAFRWPFPRVTCPFCGNGDPATLGYFTADDGPVRVGFCRSCRRYLKSRDSRKGRGDVPLDVEDIVTLHLDVLAGKEGFERER